MKRVILSFFIVSFMSLQANALFDLRIHTGAHQTKADFGSLFPELTALPAFGADFLLDLPMVPFGFGLRYEQFGGSLTQDVSGNSTEVTVKSTRMSALISKRFIDLFVHVGVLASLGLSHSNTLKLSQGGTEVLNMSPKNDMTYSIGLDVGIHLGVRIALELGYMSYILKESSQTFGAPVSLTQTVAKQDIGGTYGKFMLGFGF